MTAPVLSQPIVIDIAEPVFRGHFPEMPILPGVFVIRFFRKLIESSHLEKVFSGKSLRVVKIRFLKPVRPGETLEIQATCKAFSSSVGVTSQTHWDCQAKVQGETVFTGKFIQEAMDL